MFYQRSLREEGSCLTRMLPVQGGLQVERVIRRLKVFKIISHIVSINLTHKMDKVRAALVNMQGEIIHEDAD